MERCKVGITEKEGEVEGVSNGGGATVEHWTGKRGAKSRMMRDKGGVREH